MCFSFVSCACFVMMTCTMSSSSARESTYKFIALKVPAPSTSINLVLSKTTTECAIACLSVTNCKSFYYDFSSGLDGTTGRNCYLTNNTEAEGTNIAGIYSQGLQISHVEEESTMTIPPPTGEPTYMFTGALPTVSTRTLGRSSSAVSTSTVTVATSYSTVSTQRSSTTDDDTDSEDSSENADTIIDAVTIATFCQSTSRNMGSGGTGSSIQGAANYCLFKSDGIEVYSHEMNLMSTSPCRSNVGFGELFDVSNGFPDYNTIRAVYNESGDVFIIADGYIWRYAYVQGFPLSRANSPLTLSDVFGTAVFSSPTWAVNMCGDPGEIAISNGTELFVSCSSGSWYSFETNSNSCPAADNLWQRLLVSDHITAVVAIRCANSYPETDLYVLASTAGTFSMYSGNFDDGGQGFTGWH